MQWENRKLSPSKLSFIGFPHEESKSLGSITFKVSMQDEPMYINFYVATKGEYVEHVILGRLWMRNTNCQLNWGTRQYLLKVNNRNLTGPSMENQQLKVFKQESDINITNTNAKDKDSNKANCNTKLQPCRMVSANKSTEGSRLWLWTDNLLGSKAHTKQHYSQCFAKALPKYQAKAQKGKSCSYLFRDTATTTLQIKDNSTEMGPLKKTLQAQQYYQGATQLWLPKTSKTFTRKSNKGQQRRKQVQKSASKVISPQSSNRNTYQWIPIIKKWMEPSQKATSEAKQSLQIRETQLWSTS